MALLSLGSGSTGGSGESPGEGAGQVTHLAQPAFAPSFVQPGLLGTGVLAWGGPALAGCAARARVPLWDGDTLETEVWAPISPRPLIKLKCVWSTSLSLAFCCTSHSASATPSTGHSHFTILTHRETEPCDRLRGTGRLQTFHQVGSWDVNLRSGSRSTWAQD